MKRRLLNIILASMCLMLPLTANAYDINNSEKLVIYINLCSVAKTFKSKWYIVIITV